MDDIELFYNIKDSSQSLDQKELSKLNKSIQDRYEQDTKLRKRLTNWCMWLITSYLVAVIAIVILQGFSWFNLKSSEIITLLSTTTVNITALMVIILNGYFKVPKRQEIKSN